MKIGKNARDIFAPTSTPATSETPDTLSTEVDTFEADTHPQVEPGRKVGRPTLHQEEVVKITMVLLARQVVYLDNVSNSIRKSSGSVVKRSEILRALVEALEAAAPDWSEVRSQSDLVEQLKARLQK